MNRNQDIDQMLEDFLNENHVEDAGFSDKVLSSLPREPRLVWLTHIYPVMGLMTGLLAAWYFEILTPQTFMIWFAKAMVFFDTHMSISASVSVAVVIGAIAAIGYFLSEKIREF